MDTLPASMEIAQVDQARAQDSTGGVVSSGRGRCPPATHQVDFSRLEASTVRFEETAAMFPKERLRHWLPAEFLLHKKSTLVLAPTCCHLPKLPSW